MTESSTKVQDIIKLIHEGHSDAVIQRKTEESHGVCNANSVYYQRQKLFRTTEVKIGRKRKFSFEVEQKEISIMSNENHHNTLTQIVDILGVCHRKVQEDNDLNPRSKCCFRAYKVENRC